MDTFHLSYSNKSLKAEVNDVNMSVVNIQLVFYKMS